MHIYIVKKKKKQSFVYFNIVTKNKFLPSRNIVKSSKVMFEAYLYCTYIVRRKQREKKNSHYITLYSLNIIS
jgi:hypothetical protein